MDTLHVRHSNVHRSGSPLNLTVFRISRIGCAQLGHRGGVGLELVTRLALIGKTRLGAAARAASMARNRRRRLRRNRKRCCVGRLNRGGDLSATWL